MRYWSFTRIEWKPRRSPRKASSRLPGGTRRSSMLAAASMIRSLRSAARWISTDSPFTRSRANRSFVRRSANPVITHRKSNATREYVKGWPPRGRPLRRGALAAIRLAPGDPEPRFRGARGVSHSLRESEANSPVRNLFRPPYFKRRARNWRAERFSVNALTSRPGRSRLAACARAFAARGCVCGGLSRWASAVAWPSAWLTVAEVSPGCLSGHRETFPRSGVSGQRSRRVYVSRVITDDSAAATARYRSGRASFELSIAMVPDGRARAAWRPTAIAAPPIGATM